MSRRAAIRALLIAVGLGTALAPAPLAAAAGKGRAALVVVDEARLAELAPRRWVPALVTAAREARVAAEVAGRLLEVREAGARVAEGEAVARLEDRQLLLQLEEARAEAREEEARLRYLEAELRRLRSLAQRDLAAATRRDEVRSLRDASREALAAARARAERLADLTRRSRILAPFAGVVAERLARPGERVAPGDPVVRLVDPQRLEIRAPVPPAQARLLRPGLRLSVQGGGREAEAAVLALAPPGEGHPHAWLLRLEAPPGIWALGEAVRVAVPEAVPRRALTVPRDALVLRREGVAVFRLTGKGTAERVPVTVGVADGMLVEVRGALQPGDRVVVRGAERLRPGQPVKVLPAPPGAR